MGKEWLGRTLDKQFLKDIADLNKNITPCGESGEFHTLVIDGPIFKKHMEILETETVKRGEHWFWDIKRLELVEKGRGEVR
jgi:diphthine-ammonia ligase